MFLFTREVCMAVSFPYFDLHCDTLYLAWKNNLSDIFEIPSAMSDVSKILRGGCRLQLYAIFMPTAAQPDYPGDEEYIRILHNIFSATVRTHNDAFIPAVSMEDAARSAAGEKVCGMLSMEDGRAVNGDLNNILRFYNMGVRVMGLTWNSANCFGYPNSFDRKEMEKGLTDFGKESIPYMEDLGMIVDVSHLSDGGFWDVARFSRRPFIASHSNCRALNPHPRSMTDSMIRALADRGGVMGLNFCPEFLTEDIDRTNCTVDALARQLRHRINAGGLECAAIGTDFDGIDGSLEIPSADHMPDLFESLLNRGFTSRELDHISHLNAERVFREIIG